MVRGIAVCFLEKCIEIPGAFFTVYELQRERIPCVIFTKRRQLLYTIVEHPVRIVIQCL